MTNESIMQAIYRACETINQDQDAESQLVCEPETWLLGGNSVLDSLKLVGLIIAIEREIEKSSGFSITIADDRAMSQKSSPFRTIQSLSEYISNLLREDYA